MENRISRSKLIRTRISTDLCYHSLFQGSDLTGAQMVAYQVARFCNVESSTADGSRWQGYFYNQYFRDGSFENATFDFEGRSLVHFEGTNVTAAQVNRSGDSVVYLDGVRL